MNSIGLCDAARMMQAVVRAAVVETLQLRLSPQLAAWRETSYTPCSRAALLHNHEDPRPALPSSYGSPAIIVSSTEKLSLELALAIL